MVFLFYVRKMTLEAVKFDDGLVVFGDSTKRETLEFIEDQLGDELVFPLILTDPPYGHIVKSVWDQAKSTDTEFLRWMLDWTELWSERLVDGGAFYVWGGIGLNKFRPFFRYVVQAELETKLSLSNLITWSKKRAYGTQNNYLFTREECAYFVKGDPKKPRTFNVPLLDKKRPYAGYNKKYPAKSEYYRRTNVWTDVTEIFRGKVYETQKPKRGMSIPIEVHTNPGEWVVDMFAGSGTTAVAARELGRKFILVENDREAFKKILQRLETVPSEKP